MTSLRQVCGLLYPGTIRLGGGRGGKPELVASDVAAAIGMIADRFQREVFVAMNWPDGAALEREKLLDMLAARQRAELERQWRAVQAARLELHIFLDNLAARNAETRFERAERARLESNVRNANAACWPYNPERYHKVRDLALGELTNPNRCHVCIGRGEIMRDGCIITCTACRGTGSHSPSDRGRAYALGMSLKSYQAGWRQLFEWTFALLRESEVAGNTDGSAALG